MPRTTHPRSRHRHDRAHIRFHRDRKVRARARAFARASRAWTWDDWSRERLAGPWGRHEDEQWWMGCHRSRCGICGAGDAEPRRAREDRAWRKDWL